MPQFLSMEAQSLLRALFKRTPSNRLGYGPNGFENLKNHEFFATINWVDLLNCKTTPPFKPACSHLDEALNFDSQYTSIPPFDSPGAPPSATANALFRGFSYVAPSFFTDFESNKAEADKTSEELAEIKSKNDSSSRSITGGMTNSISENHPAQPVSVPADLPPLTPTTAKQFQRLAGLQGVKTKHFHVEYSISDEIGRGSYAVVYKCTHRLTKNVYSVKIIDKVKRDVREEVEILMRLHGHPNIVRLCDVYEIGNLVYLIMDYLEGGELLDRICQQKCFSEREASAVMAVLSDTLQYLHKNMIVHRDLKPSNILYADSSCKPSSIRICDFGFAKQLRAENGLLMTPCYTANFAAPEVLKMQGYHAACDVWSLGVLMYTMLSGQTPFTTHPDDQPSDILARIESGKLSLDGPAWENISDQAKDLLKSMLNPEPSKRYTATEVAHHSWIVEGLTLSPDTTVSLDAEDARLVKDNVAATFRALKTTPMPTLEPVEASTLAKRRGRSKLNSSQS